MFLRAADGNWADSSVFAQILCEFKKQFEVEGLMVADSVLYRNNNLKLLGNLKWLSRTPLTIKQPKQLNSQLMESDFRESQIPGYRWSEHPSNYGGIEQRWVHLTFANTSSGKLTIKISTAKRKDRGNILDIPLCPR